MLGTTAEPSGTPGNVFNGKGITGAASGMELAWGIVPSWLALALSLPQCTLHVKRGQQAPVDLNGQLMQWLWGLTSGHMHAHGQSEWQGQGILFSSARLDLTMGLGQLGHGGSDGWDHQGERGRWETVGRREMGVNEKILGRIGGKCSEDHYEDFGQWDFSSIMSWRSGTRVTIWEIGSGTRMMWWAGECQG